MPGTSSEQASHDPRQAASPATRPAAQPRVRITNIYATPWHLADGAAAGNLPDYLQLWRFERYYRLSADQLPRVLARDTLDPGTLAFQRWKLGRCLTAARAWLFALPSGQIVATLSLDTSCELAETIDLLEDSYFTSIQIAQAPVQTYAHTMAVQRGAADASSDPSFLPERHQIVFDQAPAPDDCDDIIQRLIYRTDLPYRKQYSAIRYPAELNRRPGWLAAVGPYVSAICGHPSFIENAVFLSAVQAVAAAAQLRAIRHAAYQDVRLFRQLEQADGSTRARRRTLERIADQLGDLELELSYSVEASADLGLLVPSLRVESFHHALYESIDLAAKAQTSGRMLQRLDRAINAELTAIESIERRADEHRRIRYAVAVGFVSTVAIPAGLILAFLGINASQVNPARSMFDHHYLAMYLTVAVVIALGAVLSLAVYAQQRRNADNHQARPERRRWNLTPDEAPP